MAKTPVQKHFDTIAAKYSFYKNKNKFYYQNLKKLLSKYIPKNSEVFEVGCGTGDLLTYLDPSMGYGVDISSEMVDIAKNKYTNRKNITFSTQWPNRKWDFIFMSDVIEHLEDPHKTFLEIYKRMNQRSVFLMTMANPIWEPILILGEKLGYKMPEGPHNRLSGRNIKRIISKAGLTVTDHDYKLLIPVKIPYITDFANFYLEKYFKKICFIEYFIVKKI